MRTQKFTTVFRTNTKKKMKKKNGKKITKRRAMRLESFECWRPWPALGFGQACVYFILQMIQTVRQNTHTHTRMYARVLCLLYATQRIFCYTGKIQSKHKEAYACILHQKISRLHSHMNIGRQSIHQTSVYIHAQHTRTVWWANTMPGRREPTNQNHYHHHLWACMMFVLLGFRNNYLDKSKRP